MDESISLRELVDVDIVQAIQDSFAKTVGVSSVIFLPNGDALTRFSNPTKFCSLIQSTKEGRRRCFQSFTEMSRKAVELSEPEIMYCFAYGAHFVAPIVIDGERKATMYAGQFRPEKFSPEQLKELEKIAVEIDLDPELLTIEATNMRTVKDKVVWACLHSFFRTVKVIAELGAQAAELRQTKDALQNAHDELEIRVQERTVELTETNKELRREIAERKAAEDALRESEEKLRSIVEQSGDGIVLVDEQGTTIEWNRGQERIIGLSRAEVLGRHIWDVMFQVAANEQDNPALYERIKSGVLKILETGQSEWLDRLEERVVRRPDGARRIIQVAVFPIKTDKGFMTGAISRDTTKRKRAEDALRKSGEKYRALFETAKDAIFLSDEAGNFVDVNQAACESLGYSREELLRLSNREIDADPTGYEAFLKVRNALAEEAIFEVNQRRKDGTLLPVEITGKFFEIDGELRSLAIARDITERKQVEQSLLEAEAELKHIIEVVPGIIAKVNAYTGYFTYCNPALSSILGFSSEEFLTRPFIEFIHPDDRQSTIIEVEKQLKGSPLARFENRYICKNGSYKWLEWRATAADAKEVIYAAATDITERKAAEEQIKRSLREKDVLMHEIYHRVKNNLQVVSSLLSMQARTTRNKEAIDVLSKSQSRINTMALIHTQLYESGDMPELNMRGFVGTLSEELFQSYPVTDTKITPIVHVTDRKFPVSVGMHVGLIINELLSNTIEHAFGERKEGTIEIGLTVSDIGRVNLSVSDDGVGLPPGFDINATKTLGLHLVKILVEDQLQGTLKVINAGGTTFNMEFDISGTGGSSYGEDKNTDR